MEGFVGQEVKGKRFLERQNEVSESFPKAQSREIPRPFSTKFIKHTAHHSLQPILIPFLIIHDFYGFLFSNF